MFARLWYCDATVVYHPDALVHHYRAETGGQRRNVADQRETYYRFGRSLVRLRRRQFRDTRLVGLLLLLLIYEPYYPPPVSMRVATALRDRDPTPLWIARGYPDGGAARAAVRRPRPFGPTDATRAGKGWRVDPPPTRLRGRKGNALFADGPRLRV